MRLRLFSPTFIMVFAYRNQPYRGLYLAYQFLRTLILFPYWLTLYTFPACRPRRTWTFKRALIVKILRHIMDVSTQVGVLIGAPDHKSIVKNSNGVWVPPVDEDQVLTREIREYAKKAGVKPVAIPGYWVHKRGAGEIRVSEKAKPDERLLILFHGGAYTALSGHHSSPPASIGRGLLNHSKNVRRAFSLEYRLSRAAPYQPRDSFPAALLDGLAAYLYAVKTLGFKPENIILEGDSAGGNLVIALTRYLVNNQKNDENIKLPAPPGQIVLLSPWVDLSSSHDLPGSSGLTFMTDFIGGKNIAQTNYSKDAFSGVFGEEGRNTMRYISPASIHGRAEPSNFKGFPKTLIVVGGCEKLLDQIAHLKKAMVADGVDVTYDYYEDAVHDFIIFKWHEPERTLALKKIAGWIE